MIKIYFMLSVLTFWLCLYHAEPTYVTEEPKPWDFLIFTQQWPVTVCREWTDNNPSHKCDMPKNPDSWTIHGIWPTKLGTIGPAFCNSSWHFDPEAVKSIETPLSQYWAGIEAGKSIYGLWAHEWTKHGTCAAQLESLNSEFKYFSQGLKWISKFNMTDILKEAGITPSNSKTYHIFEINDAIQSKLGVAPMIECRHENRRSWLVELRICFDKKLQLINCYGATTLFFDGPSMKSIITNCESTKEIIYPENMAPNSLVNFYKLITWVQWFTM